LVLFSKQVRQALQSKWELRSEVVRPIKVSKRANGEVTIVFEQVGKANTDELE